MELACPPDALKSNFTFEGHNISLEMLLVGRKEQKKAFNRRELAQQSHIH